MNKLLMTAAVLIAVGASPAHALLQLSISDGATTFSCADGELSCDLSGGANNLLTVDTSFDGFFVQLTLAQSTFGTSNVLQLSSDNIQNNGSAEGTLTFVASDINFLQPAASVQNAASLTFNDNVGASDSTLKFWADAANVQGANPNNTPGSLLESVSGHALTNPDSFAGANDAAFTAGAPFSMTEGAALDLIAGGSITGFNQSMTTSPAIPEPATWAMLLLGAAGLTFAGFKRRRRDQLAALSSCRSVGA